MLLVSWAIFAWVAVISVARCWATEMSLVRELIWLLRTRSLAARNRKIKARRSPTAGRVVFLILSARGSWGIRLIRSSMAHHLAPVPSARTCNRDEQSGVPVVAVKDLHSTPRRLLLLSESSVQKASAPPIKMFRMAVPFCKEA